MSPADLKLPSQELRDLYAEIAGFTRPKCGKCRASYQCCSPEYCDLAVTMAFRDYGIDLTLKKPPQNGQRAPYLDAEGVCQVEPWLRPLCAVHVCESHLWTDLKFHNAYMALRDRINDLQVEEFPLDLDGLT